MRSGASHVSGLLMRHEPLALMCSADRVLIIFAGSLPIDPNQVVPIPARQFRITPSSPSQLERAGNRYFCRLLAKHF
jgi:hypothetical protein